MSSDVDLKELAIDRQRTGATLTTRSHVLTRYVLPLTLAFGFLSLVGWASRDLLFPPKLVTVVPVFSTTAEVRQAGTPLFKAAGWIEPRPTPVRVAALAPGVVEKLLVVEDQPVKAGEPIAELIKVDAELRVDRARAELEIRQAEREEATAAYRAAETRFEQPVHLEAELGEAEASLARIRTELKNLPFAVRRAAAEQEASQRDYEGKIAARGVVAGVAIDLAKNKLDSAQALVEELRDRYQSLRKEQMALLQRRNALESQLQLLANEKKAKDEAQARIKAAKARVDQARVAVAEAELQLQRMTIEAPIEGRVFRLIAHPGARIGSGMTHMLGHDGSTVVTMYRPNMLQVRVDVRFEDIPKVHLKQPVEIDNPVLSAPLVGEVLFISSEADIQKNTLQVKVAIAEPHGVFKPEMLVDVTFLAPKRSDTDTSLQPQRKLYVLQQLIQQGEHGPFVWLADQSKGIARRAFIQTGAPTSNGLVQVMQGLTVSSRVISGGTDGLRDGARIKVTAEDATLDANPTGPERNPTSPSKATDGGDQ